MLIQSLLILKTLRAIVRDIYRKYLKSSRNFMQLAEQRAIEVSPDQKPHLLNCFRLQHLWAEQRSIRFQHLLKSKSCDCALFKSLDEISQRLDKDWSAEEDSVLQISK
jgi:hypothetical protein